MPAWKRISSLKQLRLIAVGLCLVFTQNAAARTWTSADGSKTFESELTNYDVTSGQETVSFFYAQPGSSLARGITTPEITGAKSVKFHEWPKSLKELATAMSELVE